MNRQILKNISKKYSELFEIIDDEIKVFSPGRINVLGEHIDYNNGKVLPAAINLGIYLIGSKRDDSLIKLYASDFNELVILDFSNELVKGEISWANYVVGVIAQFHKKHVSVPGFNLVFEGDLPIGAGLSSSAALECGTAVFINHLSKSNIDKIDLLKMAQSAEHDFAGVQCGIMDQFASMMGKANKVIMLDTNSLSYHYLNIDQSDYCFVLIDSCVKHSLASSEYNTRQEECANALELLKARNESVENFKDCTLEMLFEIESDIDSILFKRGKYVIEEIARVEKVEQALQSNDLKNLGHLMCETHIGLSEDYEVSCNELDFLFREATKNELVLGSRMMGGGFGGCTLNLVDKNSALDVAHEISNAYQHKFNVKPTIIPVILSAGTTIINQKPYL